MGIGGEQRDEVGGWEKETFPWLVCSKRFWLTHPRQGLGRVGERMVPSSCLLLLPFLLPNTGFGIHKLNPPLPLQILLTLSIKIIQRQQLESHTKADLNPEWGVKPQIATI